MNFLKYSSALFRCCLALTLLFSLWATGAQDIFVQDMPDQGGIVLNLDADSSADDAFEQLALVSGKIPDISMLQDCGYPRQVSHPLSTNCYSPPDRPPAQFV